MKNVSLGYSLIELIAAVGVISILTVVGVNLFFSTTVGSTRDNTTRTVKQEGDYIISRFEKELRGAKRLLVNNEGQECVFSMVSLGFEDFYGNQTIWSMDTDNHRIQVSGVDLTSEKLFADNLTFDCDWDTPSNSRFIKIGFDLEKGRDVFDKKEEKETLHFETSVVLRNK